MLGKHTIKFGGTFYKQNIIENGVNKCLAVINTRNDVSSNFVTGQK